MGVWTFNCMCVRMCQRVSVCVCVIWVWSYICNWLIGGSFQDTSLKKVKKFTMTPQIFTKFCTHLDLSEKKIWTKFQIPRSTRSRARGHQNFKVNANIEVHIKLYLKNGWLKSNKMHINRKELQRATYEKLIFWPQVKFWPRKNLIKS